MESYTESFFALVFTERVTAFKQKLAFSVILITFSSSDWDWASCREPIGAAEVSKPMGTVIQAHTEGLTNAVVSTIWGVRRGSRPDRHDMACTTTSTTQ